MAISFIDHVESENFSASTSHVVTMPDFVQDDLVVICLAATAGADPMGTYTDPSGWTEISPNNGLNISAISAVRLQVYYRVMQSGDPATVTFTQSTSSGFNAHAVSYRGVDPTTPIQTQASQTGGPSTSAVHLGVTTTVDNEWILRIIAQDDQASHTNLGITWRNSDQGDFNGFAAPGDGLALGIGDEIQESFGGTGTSTTTLGVSEAWGTFTIAINPILTTYKLEGDVRDLNLATVGTVRCVLLKHDGAAEASRIYEVIDHVNANGSGLYSFTGIIDNDSRYMVVAYNDEATDRRGCTNDDLTPVIE